MSKLVYLEEFGEVQDAFYREKQLKNWKRAWKEELIREENPAFDDLSAEGFTNPREIPRKGMTQGPRIGVRDDTPFQG